MKQERKRNNIRRMIQNIREPPTSKSVMNLSSVLFLLLIISARQVEKMGLASSDGYAPITIILITIALLLLSFSVEILVAVRVLLASWWRLSAPDYLAVGVLKEKTQATEHYRNSLASFFGRHEANFVLTASTVIVAVWVGMFALIDGLNQGVFIHALSGAVAIVALLAMIGHSIITVIAKRKRENWLQKSDEEIETEVRKRYESHPDITEVYSLDELENLLEQAGLRDEGALQETDRLETYLYSYRRRGIVLTIIIGVTTILLLL
ncbi:MAG: hypothetical protein GF411_09200 [Candidatus Lokiarchaeota archaeon]|nr:hypothetical protein [Candidatus Lokiarchaeota archaeon]